MIDDDWIKNLAKARYNHGQWQTDNPAEIERRLSEKIRETMSNMFIEARDACDIFNQYCKEKSSIQLLPIEANPSGDIVGLILLLEKNQIKLVFKDSKIFAVRTWVIGFKTNSKIVHEFHPCFDALGALFWKAENSIMMTTDLIVKLIFEDLVKSVADSQN